MLEGLAAWVLNNYIGEYVENLNTHQLSIGVFQGQIELENLPLKKDALKKLDLPLEVKSGFIGRIHLSIPVKRLKSEPWVITLERLYLIAGPLRNEQYNETEEKQKEYETKQVQLKALEEKWKQEEGTSSGGSLWSVTPMFTNILENIQLKVKDVHIRYEDDITIPGSSFACGITIKSLSAQSTDASWQPKFVSKYETDMMRKLVDLQGFSTYWDIDCEMVGDLDRSELEDALQRPMFKCTKTGQFKDHEFLLEPVCAQAKMKRNTSALPLRSVNNPRITLDIQLEKIPLSLSEKQYRGMVAWVKEFTRYEKRRKYRRWKPMCKVKEGPRAWWKYAIDANLHAVQERNRRRTVEYITKRCRDNCLYVDAYIDYVALGTTYMEERMKEHMDQMEHDLTFDEIKLLREIARVKMKDSLRPKATSEETNEQTSDHVQTLSSDDAAQLSSKDLSGDTQQLEQSQGLFQRWFPGWTGWYSSPMPNESQSTEGVHSVSSEPSTTEDQNFEQEVMDILNDTEDNNTLLRRDTVFAHLNFQLQSGIFQLLHDTNTAPGESGTVFLELECSEISMDLESRPRTNSLRFEISVGGLYLRDKMTANTIMPVLIAPQQRDRSSNQNRQLFSSVLGTGLGRLSPSLPTTFLGTAAFSPPVDHTLFELVYEKKPQNCKADYRLDIKTKPLDILYNPNAIKRLKDFFTVKKGLTSVQSDIELAAAAKSRYEAIKKQTEEELKHTIDELLEKEDRIKAKRWSFNLDIAAPQIIIPLNFTEVNSMLVVFDLGRLQFQNVAAGIKDELVTNDEDEEEDFVTPSSSPPQECEETDTKVKLDTKDTKVTLSDIFSENLSEAAIRDKIYDKYKLSLSDLQVMVGKSKDNWRFAHTKGTSHLHIVDKFSISLQLDRRLLYTSDPQWPKATMAGTLPTLTLHINEAKIQALRNCAKLLTESTTPSPVVETHPATEMPEPEQDQSESTEKGMYYSMYQAYSKSFKSHTDAEEEDARQTIADSILCLMQFSINRVSLEVQSRGRSVAELQVQGVNANFTMRPFDTSVSFSLHSLLVVDALQTFGPDFELLVASHKNLCLDSQSGSIRDSEPNSPQSPQSPMTPSSPAEPAKPLLIGVKPGINVVDAASSALQGLTKSDFSISPDESPVLSPGSNPEEIRLTTVSRDPEETVVNDDALIKVELDLISPSCPTHASTDETLHIANIQFNNLDFIANQQTLMELMGFFHRVMPSRRNQAKKSETLQKDEAERLNSKVKSRWELSAEFHRLNILLMRVEDKVLGRKVATATMSEARVSLALASSGLTVKGFLGGVQVQNLTTDVVVSRRHQKVLSIGCDPQNPAASLLSSQYDLQPLADMYKTAHDASELLEGNGERAFTFSLFKPNDVNMSSPDHVFSEQMPKTNEVIVVLKLASVCYTHSPDFLKELSLCVTEFKGYMTNVGSSLKVAAKEMAIGLVNQRSDLHFPYGMESTPGAKGKRAPSMGDLVLDPSFDSFSQSMEELAVLDDSIHTVIKLDMNLETPVIFLPRKPDSPEVLVLHLGRISVRNFDHPMASSFNDSTQFLQSTESEKIYIEVRDMSMYSVNLDQQKLLEEVIQQTPENCGLGPNTSAFLTPQPGGYKRTNYGIPVLHDTILELTVEKRQPLACYTAHHQIGVTVGETVFNPFPQKDELSEPRSSVLQINGRLISPLKLALSKDVYEQILQTLDNLTPTGDESTDTVAPADLTSTASSTTLDHSTLSDEVVSQQSTSGLKLDDGLSSSSAKDTSASLKDEPPNSDKNIIIKAHFEMPIFNIEMTGDLGEGERGLVDLKLEDFMVNFVKGDPWTKSIEISLQSLIMEDLLQDKSSKHRYLMVSTQKAPAQNIENICLHLSQSCPTAMIDVEPASMPNSLPSSFHEESVFGNMEPWTRTNKAKANARSTTRSKSMSGCPCTPPPSLQMSRRVSQSSDSRLVHIKILLVEKRCPEFSSKYNNTNRFIDVDFNGLDTTINLQTWVVLLDFLGMGAKVHAADTYEPKSPTSKSSLKVMNVVSPKGEEQEEFTNSEIDLKVQSLSLLLNKAEYELAKANISRFDSHVSLRNGTFAIKGQLGSMSIQDESPHGSMYREKFTTTGNQALDFSIFNYGSPDPMLTREHDISVNLRMNSVWYVHTQRFLMETLAFAQNFNQLQDVLGRMRAASAGQKISEKAFRGSRIKIDIEAGAPIIFIPHSSKSTDMLVIDLGAISIHNTFMKEGTEGTISYRRDKDYKKQLAEDEQNVKKNPESITSGVSLSSNASLATCKSGLLEQHASTEIENSAMTQSLYGSLEQDSRKSMFESWDTISDVGQSSTSSPVNSSGQINLKSSGSLPSFCSSVGVGYSGSSNVCTVIGERIQSTPNPDSSRTDVQSQPGFFPNMSDIKASVLGENYQCLLDVMNVELTEMDLFSAEWISKDQYNDNTCEDDLVFPSYVVKREPGKVLREKGRLTLQVERNLEGEISHSVPDISIDGKLTSVHFQLDLKQYKMVRGFLAHNFGEDLEPFQTPMMSQLQDPQIHTVLSGNVWKGMSINLDLDGVTTELLITHGDGTDTNPEQSLAKFEFITSRLSYDSFSDGSKDIDLVSHEIKVLDTRYRDNPVNVRPNVFPEILKPTVDRSHPKSLQMELHFRSTKQFTRFTILLNNMRVMGIFDWLLACKDFLLTAPDNPYEKKADSNNKKDSSSGPDTLRQDSSPATVSTGVLTKRASSTVEKKETLFELRLNVTDTELVVVEDTTGRDTNAVILKSTAVFSYKPDFPERPVSCSLQSLEVFSCSLAAEDETALSIIDPMSITLELNGSPSKKVEALGPTGLTDATTDSDSDPPILEISFSTLNIRLSYNDMKLFLAILKTVPDQLIQAKHQGQPPKNAVQCKYPVLAEQVNKLEKLGFSHSDCEKALSECQGQLDEAAMWLTHNATPVHGVSHDQNKEGFSLSGFEVKAGAICVCFIDDCLDADVPLAELTFSSLTFLHRFCASGKGKASFKLTGDYYNRSLSGWEPFIETWGCIMTWNQGSADENRLLIEIQAGQVLNFNLTSSLLDQYRKTKVKWTEDYYKQETQSPEEGSYNSRKRVPFIPFAIRNQTGCKLWFATMTTKPTRTGTVVSPGSTKDSSQRTISEWRVVAPGDELPFLFEEREKIRHKHTHELKVHQVIVQVEGWREVSAVSVDKVGTYFRTARPEVNPSSMYSRPPARVVFDVTLEGSAHKVITVRSGLVIHNMLDDDVEIRLQNTLYLDDGSSITHSGQEKTLVVRQGARQAVPIPLVHSQMWIRPQGWSLDWCKQPVQWQHVTTTGDPCDTVQSCTTLFSEKPSYRFCVSVYRQPFPSGRFTLGSNASDSPTLQTEGAVYHHPGHIITLMPPVMLENLLPIDICYSLKSGNQPNIRGSIKPGKSASLFAADLSQNMELGISFDNMTTSKELVIPPGTLDYKVKLVLFDTMDRPLELIIRIKAGVGGSLKLSVSAPYWLVNKTGLPLIFKQDGAKTAAGQFEEHELARSVVPLLFSYTEKDRTSMCTMRLGKYIHGVNSKALWTNRFSLESGSGVRELHVSPNDNRPDWVYMIGIEVKQGRGRYCDTNIVTFSPRFQLDNHSSHKLAFAQKYAVVNWSPSSVDYFSALPNCMLSFHWPRVDKDNLLCVQLMNDPDSQWSGGFRIDKVDSFHINIRSKDNKYIFLRVDVVLHGATYYIVLSDANHMPPPYRIENVSEVPIVFYQTNTRHDLRTIVRPHSQVPYALDEPVLPPHITVKVIGGSSATYNLHNVKAGDLLYYENHIYLAFTGTFKSGSCSFSPKTSNWVSHMEQHELVLDVLPNNRVILKKMEAGKRSQLWRMTSTGMLQHEGSAAPRDPGKSSTSSSTFFVLDIAEYQLRPDVDIGLAIRKADDKRKATQHWMFTKDGRLVCSSRPNLCVQAKGGIFGLRDGEDAVLGPSPPKIAGREDVPIEMAVHNKKSRPGSGQLSVRVLVDGPTRVLRVTDITQQRLYFESTDDWVLVKGGGLSPSGSTSSTTSEYNKMKLLEVKVVLPEGIGLSVINSVPEELIYVSMRDINVDYISSEVGQRLEMTVNKFQVDNQLFGQYRPVLLFVTQYNSHHDDEEDKGAALQISVHKVPNNQWNADIYKHFTVIMKRLTLQIEETLLWKMLQFFDFQQNESDIENISETGVESSRDVTAATSAHLKRYYFGLLKISIHRVMLSMLTASELSPDLKVLKKSMGIPLVRFADAQVELEPFIRHHPFETSAFLIESIQHHFTEELKSQAASILGSVDFLGNPLGFFNDVAEGVSGLLEGNVGGLLKNVTHGVSNSAAKVTGSLSDGVGVATLDNHHQKIRQQIRFASEAAGGGGSGHLKAGIKALGHGLFGGLTSIVAQTYTGVTEDGFEGFFTGLGKGVVGTVTKPVAGVLDFAAGAASAVRDTSRSSSRIQPSRVRKPRVCQGPGGLLPSYSEEIASGQEYLHEINDNNYKEICIAVDVLRGGRDDTLRALISNEHVYLLAKNPRDKEYVILDPSFEELINCRAVTQDGKPYIKLTMKADADSGSMGIGSKKSPLVRCDTERIAQKVSQQINYAKVLYDEVKHTLPVEANRHSSAR